MLLKCCAPGYHSNYYGTQYVPVFKFLKNEILFYKWKTKIPRSNLTVNKNTVLCWKHFTEKYNDNTGARVRLKDRAVPTIFKNLPKYLSTSTPPSKRDPEERGNLKEKIEENYENWLNNDIIPNFENFKEQTSKNCPAPWKFHIEEDGVCFFTTIFDRYIT